ncbi:Uma2 family endonuclease [Leptothermofonsia sichuanensis E412]|uniref:Uma2 family endonuclease n=1 Tax=Leptothermofonsia sichuanensis TaxID=2917832 RepID=UPI001CA67F45|nr:Uma2 family endonuclease [Leptothermofonsia sichuanensis]QZZ22893.1 Uma2 family endonuclease [Leptothermofonsia sichuanensis E412]
MVTTPEPRLSVPPLENGDRLSRSEFERRYEAMPHLKKAELVEGVVYMASPLRIKSHGEPHGDIIGWLWTYKTATPGVVLGIEPTVRLDLENEPQPDAVLLVPGRQATIGADDYIEGAPELVVEVAASSVAIDLHDKKRAYRRNQVQEYIVWRTLDRQLDWFVLEADDYVNQQPNAQGVVRSKVFPGLWLAVSALLSGEMTTVLSVLQQGLNSPEHQAFVQQLSG